MAPSTAPQGFSNWFHGSARVSPVRSAISGFGMATETGGGAALAADRDRAQWHGSSRAPTRAWRDTPPSAPARAARPDPATSASVHHRRASNEAPVVDQHLGAAGLQAGHQPLTHPIRLGMAVPDKELHHRHSPAWRCGRKVRTSATRNKGRHRPAGGNRRPDTRLPNCGASATATDFQHKASTARLHGG